MNLIMMPNKLLRKNSKKVILPLNKQDKKIADEMIAYINESQIENSISRPGVGIAAVQLGYLKRMFYINLKNSDGTTLFEELIINPNIIAISATNAALRGGEGCLSVSEDAKNSSGLVHRKNKIIISGYSYLQNKNVEITKSGYIAIVIQHELDHLNGKLFIDKIKKNKWDVINNEVII